jgi:dTDP-4-dehydrorhamnose 3,5-epimerase
MINGVRIENKKRIPDVRGAILHGIKSNELTHDFGEVYFKRLRSGIINGWHVHDSLQLNYICVNGALRLVLCDLRPDSPTFNEIQEIVMGAENYVLVHIPNGVANATETLSFPDSLLCNIASQAHNPDLKYRRIDPQSKEIPFDWNKKNF